MNLRSEMEDEGNAFQDSSGCQMEERADWGLRRAEQGLKEETRKGQAWLCPHKCSFSHPWLQRMGQGCPRT